MVRACWRCCEGRQAADNPHQQEGAIELFVLTTEMTGNNNSSSPKEVAIYHQRHYGTTSLCCLLGTCSNNSKDLSQFTVTPNWITNTNDIRQGNGNHGIFILKHGVDGDDVLMSILFSLFKLWYRWTMRRQRLARIVVQTFTMYCFIFYQGALGLNARIMSRVQSSQEWVDLSTLLHFESNTAMPERAFTDANITVSDIWDEL